MKATSSVIVFALLIAKSYATTDYCNKELCPSNGKHIGCKNSDKFASSCSSPSLVHFNETLQDLMVRTHNEYRNKVASGDANFDSAERMPRLKWNSELAKLAQLNVRQCAMQHDACRNTDSFHYAGQNLGYIATTATLSPFMIESYIKKVVDNWYAESSSTQQIWLDTFTYTNEVIGHFTQIVQDRATYIGCAAATYRMLRKFNAVLVACDYSYTNIIGYPVYKSGPAASKCETGSDDTYKSLCSPDENIEPKPF